MYKIRFKIMAALLLLTTVMSIGTVSASAATVKENSLAPMNSALDVDGREYKYLKGISSTALWNYLRPSVTVGSKGLSVKGVVINGVYYIPFRAAASVISGS